MTSVRCPHPAVILRLLMAGVFLLSAGAISTPRAEAATPPDTPAPFIYLIDAKTGRILFEREAATPFYPASMTKLMTAYLVFERLRDGRMSLDQMLPVSETAWRKGGSKMFVRVGTEVRLEDLLRGIIVQSGNDACIVVAEAVSGSEEAFAEEMTRTAEKLGMTQSVFRNATGWPDPEHLTTARDLAILAKAIIETFPEYYHYYAEREFTFNGIHQANRNPLLYSMAADGLKTGHTEEAGYGLAASVERGGRRLILVIHGMKNESERANESKKVMEWGFREFDNYDLFTAGETVDEAPVWLGREASVPLVAGQDFTATVSRRDRRGMTVSLTYEAPVAAPVARGTQVGWINVLVPGEDPIRVPLVAGADVAQLGPFGRIGAALNYLVWGNQ